MSSTAAHADVATFVSEGEPERLEAADLLSYVVDRFHPNLTLACSFQKEDSVLLDLLLRTEPKARVFALDTHVLFPETYALWRQIEKHYGVQVEVYEGPSLGRQAATHGEALWESNPNLCCSIRKVEPLARALSGRRLLDLRDPARPVADPRRRAQARLGRASRDLEDEPARRLVGRRRLDVHPRSRPSGQRASQPRICVDRVYALHAAGRRSRGPLVGNGEDRVRPAPGVTGTA